MKCSYCATPILSQGTNCKNCGGPLPTFPVMEVLDVDIHMSRSMIEVTTHSDSVQQFIGGLPRARVTLEIDPRNLKDLNMLPAWVRWPGGAPT